MNLPLAEQFRPHSLSDIFGQDHLIGEKGLISEMIEKKHCYSLLLWGPPGSGKTTIARVYAKTFDPSYISFSATTSKMSDLKSQIEQREKSPLFHRRLIVFVDEIHRFNKAQQDTFLPLVENGNIILIGATTENPSFAINSALLSRLKTFRLNPLTDDSLNKIIDRFLHSNQEITLSEEAKEHLIHASSGDARYLFSLLELIQMKHRPEEPLSLPQLKELLISRPPIYDKHDEQHYNLISALHKAVRGSDPQAALYWLARILNGGEDPLYLIRRMIRMASEDIGLADPQALTIACNTLTSFQLLGSPEGELAIANCIIYLSLAPKSNSGYIAYQKAGEYARQTAQFPPPNHILNAPNQWMKQQGYGKNYQYDHDTKYGISGQNYFPDHTEPQEFYVPVERGFEREHLKRLAFFKKIKESHKN
ncbi:MAG: replication-associated recombination protein A [Simkaniaceae bacterium]|nr:replication-associated recombination protein A [Simkaniaceae bacterium]